jgi:hypothetical protein
MHVKGNCRAKPSQCWRPSLHVGGVTHACRCLVASLGGIGSSPIPPPLSCQQPAHVPTLQAESLQVQLAAVRSADQAQVEQLLQQLGAAKAEAAAVR